MIISAYYNLDCLVTLLDMSALQYHYIKWSLMFNIVLYLLFSFCFNFFWLLMHVYICYFEI